ncbi:uncharacterized protein LOC111059444 [Nilaparvata lugens]|uniref:uncharacterized protein LOC111059444 n=1 Tax=Nilaparvata lugens TaxID=108931 RepID=UPI00193D6B7C|nr:uncharacterized protein LOC111059444 [Nilaparvata lugens]
MSDNDFPLEAKSSDPASVPVNFSDYYIQFAHCAIKNLTLTRLDREELENTSKRPVRFLARFYHKRRAQISEGQKEEEDSSSFLAKEISQSKEKLERSLPIQYGAHTVKTDTFSRITRRAQPSEEQGGSESSSFLSKYGFQSKENVKKSQPVQYGANTIRSDEWPRISRMRAQADEQFNDASVTSKNKLYKSGLELLDAVYGPNPGNEKQKTLNHLSVTPPKCTFSPISGDISSISAPFVNPVNGKRDWLPAFKSTSPPVTKPCVCYKSGSCDFMSCDDDSCQNNVINYDFMSARNGVNEQGLGRFEFMTVGNRSSQQNIGKKDFMISGNGSSQQKVGNCDFVTSGNIYSGKNVVNDNFMTVGNGYNLQNSGNNGFITHGNSSSGHQIGNYKFMTCGNGGKPSKSCLVNDARVKNSDDLEMTLGRSRTAVSTADCLTILPPKSERWGASGLETKLKIKLEDTSDDRKDFLTIPLRPRETARESPDILYYPRRMF